MMGTSLAPTVPRQCSEHGDTGCGAPNPPLGVVWARETMRLEYDRRRRLSRLYEVVEGPCPSNDHAPHHLLVQQAVHVHGGVIFETVGEGTYAAFANPTQAARAALDAQLALQREPWGELGRIRVRMGLHTGEVELQGQHYFGAPLYRCARLTGSA